MTTYIPKYSLTPQFSKGLCTWSTRFLLWQVDSCDVRINLKKAGSWDRKVCIHVIHAWKIPKTSQHRISKLYRRKSIKPCWKIMDGLQGSPRSSVFEKLAFWFVGHGQRARVSQMAGIRTASSCFFSQWRQAGNYMSCIVLVSNPHKKPGVAINHGIGRALSAGNF